MRDRGGAPEGSIATMENPTVRLARFFALSACAFFAAMPAAARVDDYPSQPIRMILGPAPEVTARYIADRLAKELGQPVIVEPRLGAGGEIAAKAAASALHDGYTILYASSNYALATAMQLGSFDFAADFQPIGRIATTPYVLVGSPEFAAKTPAELIALAKAQPGVLNCGSSGMATPGHLSCEMFKAMAGIDVVHVPFRNVAGVTNALMANQVQFAVMPSSGVVSLIEGGGIRGIAVTTAEETPLVPKLGTVKAVVPDFVVHGWGSLVAPKNTPKAVVAKLNAALMKVLQDPEARAKIISFGTQPENPHTPEQFGAIIRAEIARWNRTIDVAKVQRGKPM